ncbi:WecB/TagA/CpsF family glycosyltransferase [Rhodococcus sp. CSLK01-03]|uniref:WecB/TagA/CpsF family glycosyltransferase n=1 Tax=Rhodococcus indonesiensis TaxID=3055869 RepID=A0ABT7RSB2_9NOCA|nr:WecB/TagA/CpsF family glycosyltransferase [Rhodococcus indonesiensis]MDM7490515.1 WecB/TagA/CpsF family glycosyltransferase [Rhodococcus indonesiensis]
MANARNVNELAQIRVGKVPFHTVTMERAVELVVAAAEERRPVPVRLSNAYCVALASQESTYERTLSDTGLTFADGMPVVWAMRLRNPSGHVVSRVRGPSFFNEVIAKSRTANLTNFLLGTTSETLAQLEVELFNRYPGVRIAGSYAPPFSPLGEQFYEECASQIAAADPDIVWVALGTPKQDYLAAELAHRTGRPCVAVGAAFDFVAGSVREAPNWVQRSGFEWAYRFASEPRRLWRRYVFGNLRFIYSVFVHSNGR